MQKHRRHPPPSLPAFKPVPRKCARYDGWTPQRQRDFIAALADTGSVRHACAQVGMADHGVYQLRRAPGAAEFAKAWEAALDHGIRKLEDIALERAIHGVEVPVYSYGKLVGSRIVYNDRLIMFMLRNRAMDRFPAGATQPALSRADRLRAEAERRMAPGLDEVRQSILRKIEAIERHDARERARRGEVQYMVEGEEAKAFERWRAAKAEGRAVILGDGEKAGDDLDGAVAEALDDGPREGSEAEDALSERAGENKGRHGAASLDWRDDALATGEVWSEGSNDPDTRPWPRIRRPGET